MLYKNGIIDGEALNNALKALNNAPSQEPQPQEKTLTDKVRENDVEKKARKQRKATEKAAIAEKQKYVINEPKENFETRESPF